MNDMNDDQVVRLCQGVKLSLAPAFLNDFFGSFNIIVFRLASMFHGSLLQSRVFEDFLGTIQVLRDFRGILVSSIAQGGNSQGMTSFYGILVGFWKCFEDLHLKFVSMLERVFKEFPGITSRLDGVSWVFEDFLVI